MATEDEATVHLSCKNIAEISEQLLSKCEDIRVLKLSQIAGGNLSDFLRLFTKIQKLILDECDLHEMSDEIWGIMQIEDLDLSHYELFDGLFSHIGRLSRLRTLKWSGLTSIPEDYVFHCSSPNNELDTTIHPLKKATLYAARLESLTDSIGDLQLLEELDLSHHDFSDGLSPSIGRLHRLTKLRLYGCNLGSLPDSIGDLESLIDLDLSFNNFSSGLNSSIGRLRKLKKLTVPSCKLTDLPNALGDLELLEELNLGTNNFSDGLNTVIGRLRRLKILMLDFCGLSSLPNSFGDIEVLEVLDLSHNSFFDDLNPTFGRLHRLKKLQLPACRLQKLPDFFGDFELLEELDLRQNAFSEGVSPAIGRLRRLKSLNLSCCKLAILPETFGELESLEVLNLSSNKFSVEGLCKNFGRLRLLKELYLTFCQLGCLPDSFGDLESLEVLELTSNNFSKGLSPTIGGLRRLKKLRLDNCELLSLPDSFGDLEMLEELYLSYNKFCGSLNPAIWRLRRLKKLMLRECELGKPPDSFGDLTLLEELNLSGIVFSEGLNPTIGRLRRLTKLDLRACRLESLPDAFGDLEELEELNLSCNLLCEGLNKTFGRLRRLTKLWLSNCKLGSLPDSFGDLQSLEEVDLSANAFSEGLNPTFSRLRRLKMVYLHSTGLKSLPDSFGDLQSLEELHLSKNIFSKGLCPAIGRLRCLLKLKLCYCELGSVPDAFGDLEVLQELDLSGNVFSEGLNPTIGRLRQLKHLILCFSRIRCLPDSLENLHMLEVLGLRNNQLVTYPLFTLRLKNLRLLDLSNYGFEKGGSPKRGGNRIKHLPVELAYTSLRKLSLYGNPITDPPEAIWKRGLGAIKSFMKAIIPGGELIIADTVNMIGNTGSGKTSLAQSLVAGSPRPTREADRTRVVNQLRISVDESLGQYVNINDFGGHEIYHSVLPIFLPSSGLLILTYDMSAPGQEQAIKRWLLTAIAKSRELRLIIVGTRADAIPDEKQRVASESSVLKLSADVLQSAITEVNAHINHLYSRPEDATIRRKVTVLRELRSSLQAAKVSTATVSCAMPDERLTKLRDLVGKMLKPPVNLPIRWCRVIRCLFIANPDGIFITMTQVEQICKAHFTDEDDDGAITVILRYLAKTSQIIWLEDHPTLRNVIFHSPQKIINACKNILHHDNKAPHLPQCYDNAMKEYEKGILQEPLFRALLGTHGEEIQLSKEQVACNSPSFQHLDVIVDFLKQFNLLSFLSREIGGKKFIIPCKLSPLEPSKLEVLRRIETTCLNRVTVRLSFVESVIPMSLFETSLSSMLTMASSMSEHHACQEVWRDGTIIVHDGVYFVAKRSEAVIILTAFSKPPDPSPWTVLHPVLVRLNESVETSWHGAPPHCAIVCPWCAQGNCCDDPTPQWGEIKLDLTTLAANDGAYKARPTCSVCLKTIPLSLCFPTTRNGSYINNESEIPKFFGKNERKIRKSTKDQKKELQESYGQSPQATLRVNWALISFEDVSESLRVSHCKLVERLSHLKVKDILYNKGIMLPSEKEEVEALTTRTKASNYLSDAIRKKGTRGCEALVEALWETRQYELYQTVMDALMQRSPGAFVAETAQLEMTRL